MCYVILVMSVWVLYYVINWIHPTYQAIFGYFESSFVVRHMRITIPSNLYFGNVWTLFFLLFVPFCGFSKRFVGIVDYSGYIIEERVLSKWKKRMKINVKRIEYSITLGKSV